MRIAFVALALLFPLGVASAQEWPEPEPVAPRPDPTEPPPPDWTPEPRPVVPPAPEPAPAPKPKQDAEHVRLTYTAWYVFSHNGRFEEEQARIGTKVTQNDMALDDTAVGHSLAVRWRSDKTFGLFTQYTYLALSGSGMAKSGFVLDGLSFNTGESLDSHANLHSLQLLAEMGHDDGSYRFGGAVGLRVFHLETLVDSREAPKRGKSRVTAVSPQVGAVLEVHGEIAPQIELGGKARAGVFFLPEHKKVTAFADLETGAYLRFFGRLRLEVGIRYLALFYLSTRDDDEKAELNAFGSTFGVGFSF